MRNVLVGAVIGLLFASVPVAKGGPAQASQQTRSKSDTISIGVDLTLGMPEDSVIKRIVAAGYGAKNTPPPAPGEGITSVWIISAKKTDAKDYSVGILTFASGKLHSAKRWALSGGDGSDVEFGRQLYFMMGDFQAQGDKTCTLETHTSETSVVALKTAYFHCGRKAIVLELEKFQGSAESVQLSEELQ